jgi:hypothetical protein
VADLENKEWLMQLPFIMAVSVGAGLLGALFNVAHKYVLKVLTLAIIILTGRPATYRLRKD